jgi:hypothetical protein
MTARRILDENQNLFSSSSFECIHAPTTREEAMVLNEKPVAYRITKPRKKKGTAK